MLWDAMGKIKGKDALALFGYRADFLLGNPGWIGQGDNQHREGEAAPQDQRPRASSPPHPKQRQEEEEKEKDRLGKMEM